MSFQEIAEQNAVYAQSIMELEKQIRELLEEREEYSRALIAEEREKWGLHKEIVRLRTVLADISKR